MISLNNKHPYKSLVWMAEQLPAAYTQKELYIRLGQALGFASANFPQNYGAYELQRYRDFVIKMAEQQEIKIIEREWKVYSR